MSKEFAITTKDNPFNPFEQFDEWFSFDVEKASQRGLNDSCSVLARIANISDEMTEKERNSEIERAIDEIIKYDELNIYAKVSKNIA